MNSPLFSGMVRAASGAGLMLICVLNAHAAALPAAFDMAGEAAESAYDHAAAKDWKGALSDLKDLNAALKKMAEAKIALDKFSPAVAKLSTAIDAKDRLAVMSAGNELTRVTAEAERAYDVKVPVEIVLLDYEGREIVIQAERGDAAKVSASIASLRMSWDKIRSTVEAKRGGAKPAAAFSAAVVALEKNTAVAKIPALAKTVLDRVDDLEGVF